MRRIVRYRNRKLYEPAERRFVTIHDLARSVAAGTPVEVRSADTGEDLTAKILSRALASEKAPVPASTAALTRLLRAGSDAAGTVADVVARVGGAKVAATMRRAAAPDRLEETLAPLTRRVDTTRHEVERIVGSLVGRGRLSWEEGARLKQDVGAVVADSMADVLGRIRDLMARLGPAASPEMASEIADIKNRLDQLEKSAARAFTESEPARREPAPNHGRRTSRARRSR